MRPRHVAAFVVLLASAAALVWALAERGDAPPPADADLRASSDDVRPAARGPSADETATDRSPVEQPAREAATRSEPKAATIDEDREGTLLVLVTTTGGVPVRDCDVSAGDRQLTTDATGAARFELAPGRTFVVVSPPGDRELRGRSGWQTVRRDEVTTVTVALVETSRTTFWCRLVDAERGDAIAGADVHVRPANTHTHSDADGFVQVALLDDDTWLDVTARGRGPRRVVPTGAHADRRTALRVELSPASALHVLVTDDAAAPVAGFELRLAALPWQLQVPRGARARGDTMDWTATSDLEGRLTIAGLPTGVALTATAQVPDGHASFARRELVLVEPREQRAFVLAAGGAVRGRVVDEDGAPVAGVRVQANQPDRASPPRVLGPARREHRAETNADGTFRIGGLGAGAWWVGVHPGDELRADVAVVQLPPGGGVDVELRARRGLPLAGHARVPGGTAARGVTVDLHVDGEYVDATETDGDGRFRFTDLPEGPCELRVEPFGTELGLLAPVAASAGDEHVELELTPVYGVIAGRTFGGGEPWVVARRRDGDDAIGARVELDGSFRYPGVRAGIWDLTAADRAGNVAWVTGVVVGGGQQVTGLRLDLTPGALLLPRHDTADEFVVSRGDALGGRDDLQRGAPGQASVPPGRWTVAFFADGREVARREVVVAAGQELFVDGGR